MKLLLAFALGLLAVRLASAQAADRAPLRFEHLAMRAGLPENSAFTMLGDRRVFVWFGAQSGLAGRT